MGRSIEANQRKEEDNYNLISLITSIYGVFWGIWLTNFLEGVFACSSPVLFNVNLTKYHLLLWSGFLALIFFFSISLIKWLWVIRCLSFRSYISKVFTKFRPALVFFIGTMIGILLMGEMCQIYNDSWIGVFAITGWGMSVLFIITTDRAKWFD